MKLFALLMIVMLVASTFAKDLPSKDARSIAEAIQSGSWSIYVIYFFWAGERDSAKLEAGLQREVVQQFTDVFYAKVDCSGGDYHQVLDLFEFQDERDNFKGRSIRQEELPMVLSIVHGVGYISHGDTSYQLIAQRMPELVDFSNRKSVQRAY